MAPEQVIPISEGHLDGVSGVRWKLILEPHSHQEGVGGPEFAGCHPRCLGFVIFCPPPVYPPGLSHLSGIVPWNDPTSGEIKAAATTLGQRLVPSLSSFALDPDVTFTTYVWQRVHFGIWTVGFQTLIVGVNLNPQIRLIPVAQFPGWKGYKSWRWCITMGYRLSWIIWLCWGWVLSGPL